MANWARQQKKKSFKLYRQLYFYVYHICQTYLFTRFSTKQREIFAQSLWVQSRNLRELESEFVKAMKILLGENNK